MTNLINETMKTLEVHFLISDKNQPSTVVIIEPNEFITYDGNIDDIKIFEIKEKTRKKSKL